TETTENGSVMSEEMKFFRLSGEEGELLIPTQETLQWVEGVWVDAVRNEVEILDARAAAAMTDLAEVADEIATLKIEPVAPVLTPSSIHVPPPPPAIAPSVCVAKQGMFRRASAPPPLPP